MERHYGHYDRMLTLFWYLNDVEEGGETNFPIADGEPWPGSMASCNQGLKVKPERGAAVLWYNMDATGLVSRNALHGACKVYFLLRIYLYLCRWLAEGAGFSEELVVCPCRIQDPLREDHVETRAKGNRIVG